MHQHTRTGATCHDWQNQLPILAQYAPIESVFSHGSHQLRGLPNTGYLALDAKWVRNSIRTAAKQHARPQCLLHKWKRGSIAELCCQICFGRWNKGYHLPFGQWLAQYGLRSIDESRPIWEAQMCLGMAD